MTSILTVPQPIVFFGGTFDPVHFGHVAVAHAALTELEPKSLIVLPAGNPYQRGRAPFASVQHRVEMLRLGLGLGLDPVNAINTVDANSNIRIDERELKREGATYTFDTLTEIRAEFGNAHPFFWLIGSDAFAKLDTWHRWRDLFKLTNFAVIMRAGTDSSPEWGVEFSAEIRSRETTSDQPVPSAGVWISLKTLPPPISSTAVRAALANHESIRAMVPLSVCDYIDKHHLYRFA